MRKGGVWRWFHKGSIWIYTAGYFLYLFVSAARAWPSKTLSDWITYVSWESVYAICWPILIFLNRQ
jgi:hypothetical protein